MPSLRRLIGFVIIWWIRSVSVLVRFVLLVFVMLSRLVCVSVLVRMSVLLLRFGSFASGPILMPYIRRWVVTSCPVLVVSRILMSPGTALLVLCCVICLSLLAPLLELLGPFLVFVLIVIFVQESDMIPFMRTPYNYSMDAVSEETGLECRDPSKTVQADAESADINVIVKRFGLGMPLPQGVRMPQYGDFEGVTDFQSALNLVIAAEGGFMKFPAHIRSRFHNDPGAFLDFVGNEENRVEAERMGLVVPKPASSSSGTDGAPDGAKAASGASGAS